MAPNSFKIVFLIDQCLKNKKKIHSFDGLINIVRICVLKILTYFGGYRDTAVSPSKSSNVCENRVEWDVAYFRGNSRKFKDKPRFREFSLKHFEAFETELETRFQVLRTATEDSVLQNECSGPDDIESDVLDSLKQVLCALIHDYSWDRPDILSPVRLSRFKCAQSDRRKFCKMCPAESADVKQNFAFVVAECPQDAQDLDVSSLDLSDVLRSFLPHDVRRQFVDALGIRLFWIDIGIGEQLVSTTKSRNFMQMLVLVKNLLRCCLAVCEKMKRMPVTHIPETGTRKLDSER